MAVGTQSGGLPWQQRPGIGQTGQDGFPTKTPARTGPIVTETGEEDLTQLLASGGVPRGAAAEVGAIVPPHLVAGSGQDVVFAEPGSLPGGTDLSALVDGVWGLGVQRRPWIPRRDFDGDIFDALDQHTGLAPLVSVAGRSPFNYFDFVLGDISLRIRPEVPVPHPIIPLDPLRPVAVDNKAGLRVAKSNLDNIKAEKNRTDQEYAKAKVEFQKAVNESKNGPGSQATIDKLNSTYAEVIRLNAERESLSSEIKRVEAFIDGCKAMVRPIINRQVIGKIIDEVYGPGAWNSWPTNRQLKAILTMNPVLYRREAEDWLDDMVLCDNDSPIQLPDYP